jgi:hypothetical protein
MTLRKALLDFERSGRFHYKNDQLSANGLVRLVESLGRVIFCPLECDLQHIQLIPWLETKNETQVPLRGIITDQEYSPVWCDQQTDFYLHQLSRQSSGKSQHFIEKSDFKSEQCEVEKQLLEVFYKSKAWKSIRLSHIVFAWESIERSLSDYFSHHFLKYVSENISHLEVLSLPALVLDPEKLITVIQTNKGLTDLSCELRTNTRDDLFYIRVLLEEIAQHPSLQRLDWGETVLNPRGYQALSDLLDKNYRLESIQLGSPQETKVKEQHQTLMQRLSLTPLERFKQEQLNQSKLIALAIEGMKEGENQPLVFILNQPTVLPTITWVDREVLYQRWPEVYRANRNLIDTHRGILKIDLSEKLVQAPSKSVGYYLLEQAFALKNADGIDYLLAAGANLLERADGKSLISQMFDKKYAANPEVSRMVVHLQQSWSVLLPLIPRLTQLFPIDKTLQETKALLDNYLDTLMKRIKFPFKFIQLLSGVLSRLEDRKKEWEQAFRYMVHMIELGAEKPQINSAVVHSMRVFADLLIHDAQRAKRGLRNHSALNDGLEVLGGQLKSQLEEWQKILEREEIKEELSKEHAAEARRSEELQKESSNRIRRLEEEKARAEEMGQLERERRIKNKEEMDVARAKDKKEMEAAHAKDKEEMEAKAKKQEEEIKQLRKLVEQYGISLNEGAIRETPQKKANTSETAVLFFKR